MQGDLTARGDGSFHGRGLPLPVGKEITEADLIALGEKDFKTWALNNVGNAFSRPTRSKGDVYVPFNMDSSDFGFEFGIYTGTKRKKRSFLAEVPGKPGVFSFQLPDDTTIRLGSTADRASDGGKGLRVTSLVFPAPAEGVDLSSGIDCYLSPVCSVYTEGGITLDSQQQSILEEAISSANIKGYLPEPSPGSTQGGSWLTAGTGPRVDPKGLL